MTRVLVDIPSVFVDVPGDLKTYMKEIVYPKLAGGTEQ